MSWALWHLHALPFFALAPRFRLEYVGQRTGGPIDFDFRPLQARGTHIRSVAHHRVRTTARIRRAPERVEYFAEQSPDSAAISFSFHHPVRVPVAVMETRGRCNTVTHNIKFGRCNPAGHFPLLK